MINEKSSTSKEMKKKYICIFYLFVSHGVLLSLYWLVDSHDLNVKWMRRKRLFTFSYKLYILFNTSRMLFDIHIYILFLLNGWDRIMRVERERIRVNHKWRVWERAKDYNYDEKKNQILSTSLLGGQWIIVVILMVNSTKSIYVCLLYVCGDTLNMYRWINKST
jgi:hypothetical protein